MSSESSEATATISRRIVDGALLGASVCVGWVLHDALVFLRNGLPSTFLELVPASCVAILVGALVGTTAASRKALAVFVVVTAVLSGLPLVVDLPLSRAELWVPRAALLVALASATAGRLARWRGAGIGFAVVLGVLACAVKSLYRHGIFWVELPVVGVALLVGGWLVVSRARPRVVRAAVAVVLLAAPLVFEAVGAQRRTSVRRPDLAPPALEASTSSPNLVLIVLDTLRADRLAPYGYRRTTTPGIDAFVEKDATIFTEAYSTSPWTLPSHASLFTGLLPAEHGATNARIEDDATLRLAIRPAQPLGQQFVTLAERLRRIGYETSAIVANCAYLHHAYGLDQGYEHYDDRSDTFVREYLALAQLGGNQPEVGHIAYRDAQEITNLTLEWFDRRRAHVPFFLTLNYMDAHEPYVTPKEYASQFDADELPVDPLADDPTKWTFAYDNALAYMDVHVERVLDALRRRGVYENTVVVITADHGQSLGDHGLYGHAWTLYEGTIRVPLYVKPAGGRAVESDTTPIDGAGAHDLMLALLGLEPDEREPRVAAPGGAGWVAELFAGQTTPAIVDWAKRTNHDVRLNRIAWREGNRKVIVASDLSVLAFDLAKDPKEVAPLELEPEFVESARERARAWWTAHPPPELVQVDTSDIAEEMDALGY